MIYLLIAPLSRVAKEVIPNVNLTGRIAPEVEQVQNQFSSILTDSNVIGENLTRKLKSALAGDICLYQESVFSPKQRGQNNWLNVSICGQRTCNSSPQKKVEITFASSYQLNDVIKNELEKYKFALYLYRKSGHDLMSRRQPFQEKHSYQYSLQLDPHEVNISPSQDFQDTEKTVHGSYIDEKNTPDQTYFLLLFRENELSSKA